MILCLVLGRIYILIGIFVIIWLFGIEWEYSKRFCFTFETNAIFIPCKINFISYKRKDCFKYILFRFSKKYFKTEVSQVRTPPAAEKFFITVSNPRFAYHHTQANRDLSNKFHAFRNIYFYIPRALSRYNADNFHGIVSTDTVTYIPRLKESWSTKKKHLPMYNYSRTKRNNLTWEEATITAANREICRCFVEEVLCSQAE